MIVQKKFSTVHTFKFNEDSFNFSYVDKTGSADCDVRYVDFPEKKSVSIERNQWLRNVGLLWLVLGLVQAGWALTSGTFSVSKLFWAFIGLICLFWAELSKITYSVFKTSSGGVFVMQDKKHDLIISMIRQRKKEQLLRWYGNIDFDNDADNEISKFKWLFEQDAITQEQLDKNIQAIRLNQLQSSASHSQTLN